MPIVEGEAVNEEKYEISEEVKEKINRESDVIQEIAACIMRDIRESDRECRKAIDDLDYKVGMFAIGHHVNAVQEKYKEYDRVLKYIEAVQEDVLENIDQFAPEMNAMKTTQLSAPSAYARGTKTEDVTLKYKVNLIIDNSKTDGAPVVIDFNPTYYNLVGELEYDNEYGNLTTDFMKIKAGSMHKANGGYIIIQVQDLLSNVQAWEALRRIIKTREIAIENLRDNVGAIAVPTLKPEPIPADVKVILIGGSYYYELLRGYDEEFSKLFKIRADFDYEMEMSDENISKIAGFISKFCKNENVPHLTALLLRLLWNMPPELWKVRKSFPHDLILLRKYLPRRRTWAQMENAEFVTAEHVKKADEEREYRLAMYQEKMNELLDDGTVMIATTDFASEK